MARPVSTAVIAVFVVSLAAVPAQAEPRLRVAVKVPSAAVAGAPLTISGRVSRRSPKRLRARLQQRAHGRWTTVSRRARVRRDRRFTVRWTPPATAHEVTVRVVVLRGRRRVGASSAQRLRLTTAPEARCVTRSTLLAEGGDQDWSWAHDLIAYSRPDAAGNNQLRVMRPDGTQDRDISSAATAPGVRVDRHKTVPVWEPGGRWIVVQVESADWYPGVDYRDVWLRERAINGVASSLWAVSPSGERWVRLTNEAWPASYGAMAAHFSHDGRQLVFSRLVRPATLLEPWGAYRLILATFNVATDGTPSLSNVRDITPPGHVFAESHGFSPSGGDVLFASYGSASFTNMDIWSLSLATGATRRLTSSPQWDEHATYSPSGKRIVYFTGDLGVAPLTGDLMSMNPDGSDKRRLSAFNQPGAPGYLGEPTMVLRPTFNATGARMAVTEMLAREFPAHRRMSVLELSAAC